MHRSRSSSMSRPSFNAPGGRKRSSSIGSRLSQSSVLRRGSFTDQEKRVKDARPLTDQSYQSKCIHKLMNFLTSYNYPFTLNQKLLTSPSSKDIFRMFEFIYGFVNPGFHLSSKPEEDIVWLVKNLHYPYILKKTSLQNFGGGRHTRGSVFAMLVWLIELAQAYIHQEQKFEEDNFNKLHEIVGRSYQDYLDTGVDDYDDELDKKFETLDGFQNVKEKLEKVEQELAKSEDLLSDANAQEAQARERLDMMNCLKEDIVNTKSFIKDMEVHIQNKQTENDNLSEELQKQCMSLEEIKKEVDMLSHTCKEQKEKGISNQLVINHKQKLAENLNREDDQLKQLEKQLWEYEMKLSQLQRKMEEKLQLFNVHYEALRVILPSEFFSLQEFKARLPGISSDRLSKIKTQMQDLRKKTSEQMMTLDSKLLQKKEYAMELQHQLNASEQDLTQNLKKKDEENLQHEEFKAKMNAECEKLRANEKVVSEGIESLRKEANAGDPNKQCDLAKLVKECEELKMELKIKLEKENHKVQKKQKALEDSVTEFEEEDKGLKEKLANSMKDLVAVIDWDETEGEIKENLSVLIEKFVNN